MPVGRPFAKGQSGNPKGRPPKKRALTELLEKAGSQRITLEDGSVITGKALLARLWWQAATSGQVTFPDGAALKLKPEDWIAVLTKLYGQTDGPPRGELDVDVKDERFVLGLTPEQFKKL